MGNEALKENSIRVLFYVGLLKSQEVKWLADCFNNHDFDTAGNFSFHNMGTLAYIGDAQSPHTNSPWRHRRTVDTGEIHSCQKTFVGAQHGSFGKSHLSAWVSAGGIGWGFCVVRLWTGFLGVIFRGSRSWLRLSFEFFDFAFSSLLVLTACLSQVIVWANNLLSVGMLRRMSALQLQALIIST